MAKQPSVPKNNFIDSHKGDLDLLFDEIITPAIMHIIRSVNMIF